MVDKHTTIYYIVDITRKVIMKKIIALILVTVAFASAMTLAESRSEVNHCHTRFEKAIDSLKNCKIDRSSYSKEEAFFLKCNNGEYFTTTNLKVQAVRIKTAVGGYIFVHLTSTQTGIEACDQVTLDEFGVREKYEILHYYKVDNEQIYKYAKSRLIR